MTKLFKFMSQHSEREISEFWTSLIALDSTIEEGSIFRKETINQHPSICDFLRHCCQASHYSFDILKCGNLDCTICKGLHTLGNLLLATLWLL